MKYTHTFTTTYYYIPDSDEILPNYNLYDIFSLRNNLSNLYPDCNIIFKDTPDGNKMYLNLVFQSDNQIDEKEVRKNIDEYTGPTRLFVILFPFDSKIYTSDRKSIPTLLSNQLVQIVNLPQSVNSDQITEVDDDKLDNIDTYTMNISYKFDSLGLFVNISKTGYFENLYNMLYQYITGQIVELYNKGVCICDDKFAEKWNLKKYKYNLYTVDWNIYNLFVGNYLSDILQQLQGGNSLFLNLYLDDIERHYLSVYLNQFKIKFIFTDSGIWIEDCIDYDFLLNLSHEFDRIRTITDVDVKITKVKEGGTYRTTTSWFKSIVI